MSTNGFMVFGNVAINMNLVISMHEEGGAVMLGLAAGGRKVPGVTIDEIMTAMSAGQSRVVPRSGEVATTIDAVAVEEKLPPRGYRARADTRRGNDPQAMLSIGRRPD